MKPKFTRTVRAFLLACALISWHTASAETYYYNGFSDWTDEFNWSPSYPGTTIMQGDTAIIQGFNSCFSPNININGTLIINGDMIFSGTTLEIGSTGKLIVNQTCIFSPATILNHGSINIANSAYLIINSSQFVHDGNEVIVNGLLQFDFGCNIEVASGNTLTVETDGELQLNQSTLTLNGHLINNGSLLAHSSSYISIGNSGSFTQNGSDIIIENYLVNLGTIDVQPGKTLSFSEFSNFQNGGIVTVGGDLAIAGSSFLDMNSDIHVEPNGHLIFNGLFLFFIEGSLTNDGIIDIFSNAIVVNNSSQFIQNGTLNIEGTFDNAGIMENNGALYGSGQFIQDGTFLNTGDIRPGNSPGTLAISGNFDFGTGTYYCDINGTNRGVDYDWIDISGTATLSGASLVVDWGSFTPTLGTYDIMTFSSRSGIFSSVVIPPVTGLSFTTSYTSSKITITVALALPVEMTQFTARETSGGIKLDWQTASERNNKGFLVQRSADAKQWDDLAFIPGNGTANEPHPYSYMDESPLPGTNYYRLQQTDFDGKSEYSKVVNLAFRSYDDFTGVQFLPNPAPKGLTILYLPKPVEAAGNLKIFDTKGHEVLHQQIEKGAQSIPIALSNHAAGVYTVRLEIQGNVQAAQLLVD